MAPKEGASEARENRSSRWPREAGLSRELDGETAVGKVNVRRIGYAAGAEITGVDASKPLDAASIAAIRQAWLDHIVVYIPGQDLTPQQMRDFCAQFGELDVSENTKILPRHPDLPEVLIRANKPVTVNGSFEIQKSGAASHWHSDYPYSLHPATISFLLGKEVPSIGGDTMFANGYMAYDALSPAFKEMIDPLWAVHDYMHSPGWPKRRTPESQAEAKRLNPAVVQRVARPHPETGRKSIFIHEWVHNFVGMTEEEAKPVWDFLLQHLTRYEFLYRHRWTPKDILMWDNRCSIHIAVQDYAPEMRMMVRCSMLEPQPARTYEEHVGSKPELALTT